MPAKSKSQQRLFGMALAVRRGELKRSDVEDSVLDIVDSDMTDKEIEDFASTKHKGLKECLIEALYQTFISLRFLKRSVDDKLYLYGSLSEYKVFK